MVDILPFRYPAVHRVQTLSFVTALPFVPRLPGYLLADPEELNFLLKAGAELAVVVGVVEAGDLLYPIVHQPNDDVEIVAVGSVAAVDSVHAVVGFVVAVEVV